MTTDQLQLAFLRRKGRTAADPCMELAELVQELRGRRWVFAKMLPWGDRALRVLANASDGRIITGQRGYCLLAEATPEEIAHSADWLRSQGREMLRRSIAIRRRAHREIENHPWIYESNTSVSGPCPPDAAQLQHKLSGG